MPTDKELAEAGRPPLHGVPRGLWEPIRWIHRRRPLLTAGFVLAALAHSLFTGAEPARLLDPEPTGRFIVPWLAMLLGVVIRVWGSGNLYKNQEITSSGIYAMVRHPLYTGSLLFFLAYFVAIGDPWVGLALFVAMVLVVYYPTMIDEEAHLVARFPEQVEPHRGLPRLVPNPLRLPSAMRSDRFSFGAARRNLGLRSFSFLLLLPLLLEAVRLL